ncbi:MAG: toluene hydroxylase [Anaerolineae bacterium]
MAEEVRQSAAAGAAQFAGWDSRAYNYFEPKGRRASHYEDVTVDVQPDPERYLIQDWIISFADGSPAYSKEASGVRSSNWHKYRAPDEEWERNHFQRQSGIEESIRLVSTVARANRAFENFDRSWLEIIQNHIGALKHPEHALGGILLVAQRGGYTQMINNSILTNSSYKLRFAQDLTLYLAELNIDLEGALDESAGKDHWLNDPVWQGARKAIEVLQNDFDPLKAYFVTNVVYEALVTEPFRSSFVMQCGAMHGDFVTPAIVSTAEGDYERNLNNTIEMFHILAHDPEFGNHNKVVMQDWLKEYVPLCAEAANQMQPIWSQPQVKRIQFADALGRAKHRLTSTLAQINVEMPKGVHL